MNLCSYNKDRLINARVHNLFDVAGRITFIFMNYSRQYFQDIFRFFALLLFCLHTSV